MVNVSFLTYDYTLNKAVIINQLKIKNMKKQFLLFFLLIFLSKTIEGQQNNTPVNSQKFNYCEIFTNTDNTNSDNVSVTVQIKLNDGTVIKPLYEFSYKDPSVKPTVFTDIIKAINVMAKDGWEVVQVYAVLNGPSTITTYSYHYLLKKRIL
jgi:predicted SnoaL-like aldol condensation-catalyzing enzyme